MKIHARKGRTTRAVRLEPLHPSRVDLELLAGLAVDTGTVKPDELGAFLRREGVHEAAPEQWREAVVISATSALAGDAAPSHWRAVGKKRIRELEPLDS